MKIGEVVVHFLGKRYTAPILGVALFSALIAWSISTTLPKIGNELTYCLDDPYIHLSIARNLAEHGTWGISPNEISSASSSPLWVIILGLVYPLSSDVTIPFVLNTLFAIGLIFYADKILSESGVHLYLRLCVILLLITATPLVNLCWSGMEHTLHALLSLVFVHITARIVSNPNTEYKIEKILLVRYLFTAILLGAVRPEGMVLIGIVCLFHIIQKRIVLGVSVLLVGVLPIVAFGIWSISHGQLFLPNSVLVKSLDVGTSLPSNGGVLSLLGVFVLKLKRAIHLLRSHQILVWCLQTLSLCFLLILLRIKNTHIGMLVSLGNTNTHGVASLLITLLTLITHLCTSDAGWFYRYEAYLIPLTVISCTVVLHRLYTIYFNEEKQQPAPMLNNTTTTLNFLRNVTLIMLCVGVNFSVVSRCSSAWSSIGNYAKLIWQMQRQTARFIETYYSDKPIALTDIGAPSYYTNAHITDFYGLGNATVAKMKWNKSWNNVTCEKLIDQHKIDCAITYSSLLSNVIPNKWTKVGSLTVADDIITQEPTITFYATSPSAISKIQLQMREFSRSVPVGVKVNIFPVHQDNYPSSTPDSSTINR
jgi:hypothetical protein